MLSESQDEKKLQLIALDSSLCSTLALLLIESEIEIIPSRFFLPFRLSHFALGERNVVILYWIRLFLSSSIETHIN